MDKELTFLARRDTFLATVFRWCTPLDALL